MGKEIIVNNDSEQTRIAIVEGGELVELFIENPENERTLGDIYLGRVRKIMPSIQAAFVDIGQKQDAFLHFSDLSDNLPELLTYLQDTNPEVGHTIRAAEQQRKKQVERKHPSHAPPQRPPADEDLDAGHDGVPVEAADAPETVAAEPPGPKHVHKLDLSTRNQRHTAQHAAHQKPQPRPQDVPKPPAPPPAEEDDDEDDIPPKPSQPLDTYLKRDQRILVKIVKEPISAKGSRVSTDISLAGRFLVLVPLANYVAVSKKIVSYKERRRLRALAKSLVPEGFGVIVRTVADGKTAQVLDTDLRLLVEKWRKIERNLQGKPEPPQLVHEDVNMVSSIMRDLFTDDYDRILVDEQKTYRNLKSYVQAVAPDMAQAVQLYKGNDHIFAATRIAKEAAQVFESRVDLPTGGYLFIERTEAMHVVDVNSGRSGRGLSQEENSLKVNLEAARVVAKQIRLRDLGGIIVVDFIDLRDERNKIKVYEELRREFRKDRAVTKLLPMSDFGLIQITRQRLRPSVTTTFADSNSEVLSEMARQAELKEAEERATEAARLAERPPQGPRRSREDVALAAQVAPEELIEKMEQWVAAFKGLGKSRSVTLRVHPFMGAYLNRKLPNYPTRWTIRYFIRIQVELDDRLSPFAFRFVDRKSGDDVTDLRRLEREQQRAREQAKPRPSETPAPEQRQLQSPERGPGRGERPQGRGEQGRGESQGRQRPDGRNPQRGDQRGQGRPEQGRPERPQAGEARPQQGEGRNQQRGQGRPEQRGEPRGPGQNQGEQGQPRQEGRNRPQSRSEQPRGEQSRAEGPAREEGQPRGGQQPRPERQPRAEGRSRPEGEPRGEDQPRREERAPRGEQRREPRRPQQEGSEGQPREQGRRRPRPAPDQPLDEAAALPLAGGVDPERTDLDVPRPDLVGDADAELLEVPGAEGQEPTEAGEGEEQKRRSRRRSRGRGRRRGKGKAGAEGEAADAQPGDELDEADGSEALPPLAEAAFSFEEVEAEAQAAPPTADESDAASPEETTLLEMEMEASPAVESAGSEPVRADETETTEATDETAPAVGAKAPLSDIGATEMFGPIDEPTAEDFAAPTSEPEGKEEQAREGEIGPLEMFGPPDEPMAVEEPGADAEEPPVDERPKPEGQI